MSGDTCILNSHDILLYISNYRSDVSILFIYEDFPMVYNNNEKIQVIFQNKFRFVYFVDATKEGAIEN